MDLPESGHFEFIEGDILDRANLTRSMEGVTDMVHLAAIVRTPLSFDRPEHTTQVNHWGTASVVDCAIETGVERLVYASSASVYGPGGPFTESDVCQPVGPYASSKLQGEHEVHLGAERRLKTTILRLGTTFGHAPAMRFDTVASRFAFLAGVQRPLVILGKGDQTRPLIHVEDASAVIRHVLLSPGMDGQLLNAATMNPSVNEIADTINDLCGGVEIKYTDQDMLNRFSFDVDSTKLMETGFTPKKTLKQGLVELLKRWEGYQPFTGSVANPLTELDS
jgi:nucleoside-diphosphate-sugar epimerase